VTKTLKHTTQFASGDQRKWTVDWNIDSRDKYGAKRMWRNVQVVCWNKRNTQPALDETETKTKQPID